MAPRWTKDWTQSHFRLYPLTYMDLFDSGGREKYLNLRALLFSCLRIVRLYCHHGIGSFFWRPLAGTLTIEYQVSLLMATSYDLCQLRRNLFFWSSSGPLCYDGGATLLLAYGCKFLFLSFPSCGRMGMLSWTWS